MRRALAIGFAALATAAFIGGPATAKPKDDGVGTQAFGQVVVNEVASRGVTGTAEDMVELFNPSKTIAADISNWEVRIYSSAGTLIETVLIPEGTVLQPFGSGDTAESLWTISSPGFTGGSVDQPGAITMDIPDSYGVALFKFNPGGAAVKVDGVATSPGATQALEGQALTPQQFALDALAPSYGRDLIGSDLNNNKVDFKLLISTPDQLN